MSTAVVTAGELAMALAAAGNGDCFLVLPGSSVLTAALTITANDLRVEALSGEVVLTAASGATQAVAVQGDGCTFTRVALEGNSSNSFGFDVSGSGNRFVACRMDGFSKAGVGYGMLIRAGAKNTAAVNCMSSGCRHAFSAEANGGWMPTIVQGWTVRDTTDAGLDCHPGVQGVSFLYNDIAGCGSDGIIHQGSHFQIVGNVIGDVGRHQILIQPLGAGVDCIGTVRENVADTGASGASRGLYVELKDDATYTVDEVRVELVSNALAGGVANYLFQDRRLNPDGNDSRSTCPDTVLR